MRSKEEQAYVSPSARARDIVTCPKERPALTVQPKNNSRNARNRRVGSRTSVGIIRRSKMYPDEREAEKLTQQFLAQCCEEGRISGKELAEINLDRGGFGCVKPDTLIRFADFVARIQAETGWPVEDVQRVLDLHLQSKQLTIQHLELYLNYPAWTEDDLANAFGLTRKRVSSRLQAIRRAWPGLRFDITYEGNYGVPGLKNMKRIETSANSDDRLNDQNVIRF